MLALALCTATTTAEAVTDEERSGARAAASAGADAFDAGRYSEAIDYFQRAEALVHSPVHLIYIGRAQVKLGQFVKAGETFIRIKNEGAPAGSSRAVQKAVEDAAVELDRLNQKMPYVVVKLETPPGKKVKVTMDGREIPAVLVGIQRPVDPGTHKFRATGDGLDTGDVTITVKEGTRETVVLKPQPPAKAAPAPAPTPAPAPAPAPEAPPAASEPTPAPAEPAPAATTPPGEDRGSGQSGLRIASYAALGVGVAGLAAGTIFGLQAKSKADEADELCGGSRESCALDAGSAEADEVNELNDASGSAKTLSIVGFAVGGVGVAAGVTLFVLSSGQTSESNSSRAHVTPWIGYRSAGLSGRF